MHSDDGTCTRDSRSVSGPAQAYHHLYQDHVRLVKLSIVRDGAAHARSTRHRADKKQTTRAGPDIYKGLDRSAISILGSVNRLYGRCTVWLGPCTVVDPTTRATWRSSIGISILGQQIITTEPGSNVAPLSARTLNRFTNTRFVQPR